MTMHRKKIRGVILSGGRSSRFGSDKARARLADGSTVLEFLTTLLSSLHLEPVVIVDRPGKYHDLGISAGELCDVVIGKGPLGGLLTAYQGLEADAFLVLSCDMPCVDSQAILNLLTCDEARADATLYTDGQKTYPFPAIYARQTLSKCAERIWQNDLSVTRLIGSFSHVKKIPIEEKSRILFNMNTLQDFENLYNTKQEALCPCPDPRNSFSFL